MSKFRKKNSGETPKISTASLPDIVFMLLFFFMVATVLRDNTLMIQNTLPAADQIQKLDKKDRVIYIYAGKPSARYQDKYGNQPRIQLNDKFATVSDVGAYVLAERASKREELQNVLTTALKVDGETKMGLISDIKQELRKVNALKINSTLALIGAIVAEFFGTPIVGMGFRISAEIGRLNVDIVWATILVAAVSGSMFYALITICERSLTSWHPSIREN